MEFDTTASDALAANESEIARLRADLARAETLLAQKGILFTRMPNPAMPWLKPQDNSAAIAKADAAEAALVKAMDALCGPTAYHRNNGPQAHQSNFINASDDIMLDWIMEGSEPFDDALVRRLLGEGAAYEKFMAAYSERNSTDGDVGC